MNGMTHRWYTDKAFSIHKRLWSIYELEMLIPNSGYDTLFSPSTCEQKELLLDWVVTKNMANLKITRQKLTLSSYVEIILLRVNWLGLVKCPRPKYLCHLSVEVIFFILWTDNPQPHILVISTLLGKSRRVTASFCISHLSINDPFLKQHYNVKMFYHRCKTRRRVRGTYCEGWWTCLWFPSCYTNASD